MKKLLIILILLMFLFSVRAEKNKIDKIVEEKLNTEDEVSVIITLEPEIDTKSSKINILSSLTENEFKKKRELRNGFAGKINKNALAKLKNNPNIRIEYDYPMQAFLQDTKSLINFSSAHNLQVTNNITGTGQTVCILDTGINYSHIDLGSCYGANCKVISGYDFVNDDNDPVDDNGHGTHVAGIVAANGTISTGGIRGVAPDAKIISIKVLDAGGGGNTSNIIAGIEWCVGNSSFYNISVITMSLGTASVYTSYCDSTFSSIASSINNAIAKNITVFAASGNTGSVTGIASPACIKNTTSIGATTKTDTIASYSDRNALTDLFAPGGSSSAKINSTSYTGAYYEDFGTSMAAPHAAGAAALLYQYKKEDKNVSLKPNEVENALNSTGKIIDDTASSGRVFSRINVLRALYSLDNTIPQLFLFEPTSKVYTTNESIGLNYTGTDRNLDKIWYNLDNSANITLTGNITFNTSNGDHVLNIYSNDSNANLNSTSISFTVANDLIVSLNSPINNYNSTTGNITFNCSAISNVSLRNITLYHNISGNFMTNQTATLNGLKNSTNFTINNIPDNKNLLWNCLVYDSENKKDWADNFTLNVNINNAPLINSYAPASLIPSVDEGSSLAFTQTSTDSDNDTLTYSWKLDSVQKVTTQNYTYSPSYSESGTRNMTLIVSDGSLDARKEWTVTVNNIVVCGNNIKEGSEACDGSDSSSCSTNSCQANCSCTTSSNSGNGNSGGGPSGGTTTEDEFGDEFEETVAETPETPVEEPIVEAKGETQQSIDFSTNSKQTKTLSKGEKVSFKVSNEDHNLVIDEITNDNATLTVSSDPITFTIKISESKKLDLNGDNKDDLIVTLNAINEGKADITFEEIKQAVRFTGLAIFKGKNTGIAIGSLIFVVLVVFARAFMVKYPPNFSKLHFPKLRSGSKGDKIEDRSDEDSLFPKI